MRPKPGPKKRKKRALDALHSRQLAQFNASFPKRGACFFCFEHGSGGLDGRHRLLDAIRGRFKAGDSIEILCRDYALSEAQIRLALETNFQ